MINLISHTLIEQPVQQVFDFMSAPENDFQWQYGTLATARLSEGAPAIGASFRSIGHLMGQRNLSTYEVTEYEPNRKYGFRSLSGPLQSQTSYTFEIVDDSTKVTVSTQANVGNSFQVTDDNLEEKMKKQLKENLITLKNHLEAEQGLHALENCPR